MVFRAGQRMTAQYLNSTFETASQHAPLDNGTTTSASYTTALTGGTSPVFTVFVAPLSGKVEVSWAGGIYTSAAGYGLMAPQIREGTSATSGTIFHAAADAVALQNTESAASLEIQIGRSHSFSGLVPGRTYNAALLYKVGGGGGTATFSRKSISVKPLPN
jgi:hypothetical protein